MGHHHHHHTGSESNIKTAFFLNFIFTCIEIVGGIYTNSLAIISDAVHDLGDSISLGLAWYFQKLSTQKPTEKYTYGYRRFSLLGAMVNTLILVGGSIYIVFEAIPRILTPEPTDAKGMMWLAILGIVVNGAAVFKLKKGKSLNERVVSLHLFEDVLGWIAVLIASVVMQFWDVPVLDPILSLAIALYVLFNALKNARESMYILLQTSPKNCSIAQLKKDLLAIKGVSTIHKVHLWSLDGHENVCTVELSIHAEVDASTIRAEIFQHLHDTYHCEFSTISII